VSNHSLPKRAGYTGRVYPIKDITPHKPHEKDGRLPGSGPGVWPYFEAEIGDFSPSGARFKIKLPTAR
jgi:hypothetical protein